MKDELLTLDPFRVKPFAGQPRKRFRGIERLAESIRLVGQVTPIVVTRCEEDPDYDAELVDGERRLQACRLLKRPIKAVLDAATGGTRFALSVAANFCRQPHDAMEIAEAIKILRGEGRSVADVCGIFGRSTCWVYQHAYLLELSPEVQALVARAGGDEGRKQVRRGGRLTMNLAMMLRPLEKKRQAKAARHITDRKLSFTAARRYITGLVQTKERSQITRQPSPAARIDALWNATSIYRHAVAGLTTLEHAKLLAMAAALPAERAETLAAQLSDLRADLQGIEKTLKRRAKQ